VTGKVSSGPAKHFRSVLGQIVNFFYTLQGEAAGAEAFSSFDTYLAPFIAYDKLNYRQVKQALQEFLFNCNVPTRVGFQSPFTNITLDLKVPRHMAKQPVIIGGELQSRTYGEFQKEMNILNRAFYELIMEGDSRQRVFSFPIPTINITKDFDWDNPDYEPMWEATAKYGINYFSNFINSDLDPEDIRSMCPIDGKEKVLIRSTRGRELEYSTIRYVYNGRVNSKNDIYEIYSDGKFIKGSFNKFKNQKMIKVVLSNGHQIKMTTEHLNYVIDDKNSKSIKTIKGKDLKKSMYFPYSLNIYEGRGGNRDLGYFVGAYAGGGSFDRENTVVFSLENERKKSVVIKLQKIAEKYFGAHCSVRADQRTKLFTLKVHSRAAVGLCRDFVTGQAREKHYQARLFGSSVAFRKGVLDGHYATDGGNRHRIYTSSPQMVETLNMLAATLGTTTSVYKDDRSGRLGKEPNYAVLFYQLNRKKYGNFWFKYQRKLWVKIDHIEPISSSTAYCFEVSNGQPIFTVGTTGILTHNCRLRLNNKELHHRGGGLFGSAPLTGSVGVVTINLPQIAYLTQTKKEFLARLGFLMDLAQESLEIKRKVLENLMQKGLYPYSKFYLSSIKKMRGAYLANHFSTIGLVGMNEALLNFKGEDLTSPDGQKLALEILDYMRQRLLKYQKKSGHIYNLEATPAEGTSYRLAQMDKKKYPDIITAGTGTPYYTNSSQLPVDYSGGLFNALRLQDEIQIKYTGGTVFHAFLGEKVFDPAVVKNLIKKVFTKFRLPYFTLTPTFSICPEDGYLSGEHFACPHCQARAEVYSRIVGYLRPVQQWNKGKREEFDERVIFEPKL
jgi:ribonucleoside-triphosphate reductase